MNILFLTMNAFTDIKMHNIYSDLMCEFVKQGHRPYIVTPREKRCGEKTKLINYDSYSILEVKIGNTGNVSFIEKGISTVTLGSKYLRAVKKYLKHIKFGLILYSTPPITLAGTIAKLKKYYGTPTYLMLKDIFPQNAVDLQMFSQSGIVYRFFRRKEVWLYHISDTIGCMSEANVTYLLKNNPFIDKCKVEICPNAIIANGKIDRKDCKKAVRETYHVADGATLYLYGGNLGKPQRIPFLVECLKSNINMLDRHFIICGTGSDYGLLEDFVKLEKPINVTLINGLPKREYDQLANGCDVGLIFLDHRFTIPNFPSRILSYMENAMPIISCTDRNTDVGATAQKNGFGLWCESDDPLKFKKCVDQMNDSNIVDMGKRARKYLEQYYSTDICYNIIMKRLQET